MSKPAKLLAHRRLRVPPRRSCAHGAWSRRDERPITRDVSLRGCADAYNDDGVGMDPEILRSGHADTLADVGPDSGSGDESAHVGLTNVDHRLRAAFGNDYGLVVETAIGAGTKVVMRVPKFRSASRAAALGRRGGGKMGPR